MLKRILTSIVVACVFVTGALSQITVDATQSPSSLVQNVLLGSGIVATNVKYNGSLANANIPQSNVTRFSAPGTTFPLASGVLLTTGQGVAAIGPNNSLTYSMGGTPLVNTEPDLIAIANGSVTNGVFLEFDFIPSGDTVSFKYVFGSEEYPEYSPSDYNDAFGFFLSGPGISGPYQNNGINLAVLPNSTTPVTINNVGDESNTMYYVDNAGGSAFGTSIQYDGTTVVLTAVGQVVCGETYHIKLAICNVGDQGYDSGVFLEANSFGSSVVEVAVATVTGDTTIVEGCTNASFILTRPTDQADEELIIDYELAGTATEGVDFANFPNPIVFAPGEDTIIITLNPIEDGVSEPAEYVTVTVYTVSECGDTITTMGTIYILDEPIINITENDPTALCADDSIIMTASASGGYGPYTFTWSNGQTGPSVYGAVSINGPTNYIVTATDQCGFQHQDTVTITLTQSLAIDSMVQYPATACDPTGTVVGFASGFSGTPLYNWSGPGPNSPNMTDASVFQNLSPGWYYFTVTDNVCEVMDSIQLMQDQAPVAMFTASETSGCSPLSVSFTNTSQNASTFSWNFGNGQTATANDLSSQSSVFTADATVQLIASEGGCSDTMMVNISIAICGCNDPAAINYDPTVQLNNGTCLYPTPTVEVPNVFTPDGDGNKANETFFLKTTNATNVEMSIFNRWGNLMYEGSGLDPMPAWDGKNQGGTEAMDGVYFVKYKVSGYNNQALEGHGFLHLIRK